MSRALFSEPQTPLAENTRQQPIRVFEQLLPEESVLKDDADLLPYESDGLAVYRQKPPIVVLPETTEQVQKILAICNQHKVPVVARGADTGLSGGALPQVHGIVLGMAKLNRILEIDENARTAIVQPGMRNHASTEAVSDYDLHYAPDPSSQIACTIGGNAAENSGGVHCLKYGLTVRSVKKNNPATIATADIGRLLHLQSASGDTPMVHWAQLLDNRLRNTKAQHYSRIDER